MDAAVDDSSLTVSRGGPENLFGIGPIVAGPGQARGSMPTGPWLRGPNNRSSPAGLGVLLDDVLGQAVLSSRPAGLWAVTTELNIDVAAPLPVDGREVSATARPILLDGAGGLAHAELRDAAGRCLALGTTWSRFVAGVPDAVRNPPQLPDVNDRGQRLTELLEVLVDDAGRLDLPVRPDLANPRGVVHGGVLLCLAALSAGQAMHGTGLDIASVRVVYIRPAAGVLRFEPTVIHRGRSLGVMRIDVSNTSGALCTTATVTARSAIGPGDAGRRDLNTP
jgi:uncharacterized protein (TIGR00369 family)